MSRAITILPVAVLLAVCGAAQGQAVTNPGFESTAQPAVFEGWSNFGNVFRTTVAPRTGLRSLTMFGTFQPFQNFSGAFQDLSAAPGQVWDVTAFGRHVTGDAMTGGNRAIIAIEFYDAANVQLNRAEANILTAATPLDTTQSATATATAPDGTVRARVAVVFVQESDFAGGAAHMDDVSIQVTGGPTPSLINSSFENPGPAQWTFFGAAGRNTIAPRTGAGHATTGGTGGNGFHVSGALQDIPVSAGNTYRISAYVANIGLLNPLGGGDQAILKFEWYNATGFISSFESVVIDATTPTNAYRLASIEGTAPAGAISGKIALLYLQFAGQGAGHIAGQVQWDDVTVEQINVGPVACNVADIVSIGGFPPADGELTVDDYTSFINAFAGDELLADIVSIGGFPPSDGELTVDDYTSFINAFAEGCPG